MMALHILRYGELTAEHREAEIKAYPPRDDIRAGEYVDSNDAAF